MDIQEKREQMLAIIADWEQSGKSKKQYCKEKGISPATFYYWFSRRTGELPAAQDFIRIDRLRHESREIEIIYPNGVRLKVENDLVLLSQLIRLY